LRFQRQYNYAVYMVGHHDERVQDDAGPDRPGPQPFFAGDKAAIVQPNRAGGNGAENAFPAVRT